MLTPLRPLNLGDRTLEPGDRVPADLPGLRGEVRLGRVGWLEEGASTPRRIKPTEEIGRDGMLYPSRREAARANRGTA